MNEVEKMYKLANVQPQYKKRIKCKERHSIGQPIIINMPNNEVEDFVIKLAKHYTDKYEDAEITITDIEEINK